MKKPSLTLKDQHTPRDRSSVKPLDPPPWLGYVHRVLDAARYPPSEYAIVCGIVYGAMHDRPVATLSHRDIARLSGLSVSTVRRHLANHFVRPRPLLRRHYVNGETPTYALVVYGEADR